MRPALQRLSTFHKTGRSQPVDATPSDMNHFAKGGVYETRKTGQAFRGAEDRHVAPVFVTTTPSMNCLFFCCYQDIV